LFGKTSPNGEDEDKIDFKSIGFGPVGRCNAPIYYTLHTRERINGMLISFLSSFYDVFARVQREDKMAFSFLPPEHPFLYFRVSYINPKHECRHLSEENAFVPHNKRENRASIKKGDHFTSFVILNFVVRCGASFSLFFSLSLLLHLCVCV